MLKIGVVANELDCDIVVTKFELQSLYCVHFRTNTLGKGMNYLIPLVMGYRIPLMFFYKDGFDNNLRWVIW